MSEFIDKYGHRTRVDDCDEYLKMTFEAKMADGNTFLIDRVQLVYSKTIIDQISGQDEVELKFCLRDNEDAKEKDGIENWEMLIFPMYRKGREIAHGTMVDYQDSAVNGNLVIRNREVSYSTSNHCLPGYEELQQSVTSFAETYISCLIEDEL